MTYLRNFGDRLRHARVAAGRSQAALAASLGVDQATVSRWERSKQPPPSDEMVVRVAEFLGVDVAELRLAAAIERPVVADEPSVRIESVAQERDQQVQAAEVWVVADTPLELRDAVYLQMVARTLAENPRKRYTYWSGRNSIAPLLRGLEREVATHGSDPGALRKQVRAVVAPSPALWHPCAIYDPQDPYRPRGVLLLERAPLLPTGFVQEWSDAGSFDRMLSDLKQIWEQLSSSTTVEGPDGLSTWTRVYPE